MLKNTFLMFGNTFYHDKKEVQILFPDIFSGSRGHNFTKKTQKTKKKQHHSLELSCICFKQ